MKKKFFSLMMAVAMVCGLMCMMVTNVFASENGTGEYTIAQQVNRSSGNTEKDEFDYIAASKTIESILRQNKKNLTEEEINKMVAQLINNIHKINQEYLTAESGELLSSSSGGTCRVYYLGTINEDGTIQGKPELVNPNVVGYDQIIPAGWVKEPKLISSTRDVKCTDAWYGADSYTSDVESEFNVEAAVSVTLNYGWQNSGGLTETDAKKAGITTTASGSISSTLKAGVIIYAKPWHITMMRPYIIYYNDVYEGTYAYHCHNTTTGAYYYKTYELSGIDRYYTQAGIKTWSKENTDRNENAPVPEPPVEWQW